MKNGQNSKKIYAIETDIAMEMFTNCKYIAKLLRKMRLF